MTVIHTWEEIKNLNTDAASNAQQIWLSYGIIIFLKSGYE